jgi:signal transduction histidine kinase
MLDSDLHVVAHNKQFRRLLDFPDSLFEQPIVRFEDLVRYNSERGEYGAGDAQQLIEAIVARARKFEPHEIERIRPNGTAVEIRGMPLVGGGFVTIYLDITERSRSQEALREQEKRLHEMVQQLEKRNSELKSLNAKMEQSQSQLLQSEKLAAVGQLAAGVAHEINNPIGFVSSNLGTLRQYVEQIFSLIDAYDHFIQGYCISEDADLASARKRADLPYLREDVIALLTESRDGLTRVKKIVLDLRNFSRIDSADWQDADLNSGLDSTLNVAMHELKHKAEVIKHYSELPLVHCHIGQINQVFLNLLINASQAIADRGTVTLSSGVNGPWVWVSIADTGAGMTPETVSRIFEPFFTTKPVGTGTGLGLSLAYDIVKKHGGHIDVTSTPGNGSCFSVWLPLNTLNEKAV